ncbi:MAG TPA: serine/threonine-protein kinase, partial [Gemmataceae bacterium]|nr:serine/threonine-protein kinase [Gemmataceae bacterium]
MSPDPPAKGTRRATRIGKYEVVAHVASGGMGAVYRAVDTELHREVALKVLSPEMAANPAILERFRREARHAAKLHHENIVTLYEFGEVNGTYFLAMEFVEGIDLHDYINRKGQLDPEEARLILIQACQALDHAHKQGIIHRDVKPSNFLLTRKDGRLVVKLTDMGLARETRDEEFRVTRDGSTVGTVDYLSPEQARDSGSADARSDIYSLGCTVYHMLAGRPPFPSGGLAERIYKHIHTEPPDIRQFNLQVSDAFWAVLKRMLAKDPARRYQSAMDLLKEVLRLDSLAGPGRQFDENAGLVEIEEEEERPPSRASVPREDRAGKETGSDPDRRRVGTVPRPQAARVQKRPRERQDTAERPKPRTRPMITRRRENWLWPVLVALGVLIMGAVLGLVLWQVFRSRPLPLHEVGLPVVEPRPSAPDPKPVPPAPPPREAQSAGPAAPPPRWPALYQPTAAIDPGRLREEFEKPWAGPLPPEPDTVLRVSRVARPGSGQFESLAAACAAAPVGRVTVIEICDHGPLFETPVAVADRSLILRAAPGCRPLLVWDTARPPLTPTPLPLRGERGASGSSPGGEKEASGPFPGGEKEASGPFPGREKGASGSPSPPG